MLSCAVQWREHILWCSVGGSFLARRVCGNLVKPFFDFLCQRKRRRCFFAKFWLRPSQKQRRFKFDGQELRLLCWIINRRFWKCKRTDTSFHLTKKEKKRIDALSLTPSLPPSLSLNYLGTKSEKFCPVVSWKKRSVWRAVGKVELLCAKQLLMRNSESQQKVTSVNRNSGAKLKYFEKWVFRWLTLRPPIMFKTKNSDLRLEYRFLLLVEMRKCSLKWCSLILVVWDDFCAAVVCEIHFSWSLSNFPNHGIQ